jgi:hypothetical protein
MKLKHFVIFFVGVLVGWVTVPLLNADSSDGNTYKALLHKMIDIVSQIQINSAATAENTRLIKEKLVGK